jgi:hypothetical protein
MGALVVLVLVDAVRLGDCSGGANIGAGFVRLVCLGVLAVMTTHLALAVAAARRAR